MPVAFKWIKACFVWFLSPWYIHFPDRKKTNIITYNVLKCYKLIYINLKTTEAHVIYHFRKSVIYVLRVVISYYFFVGFLYFGINYFCVSYCRLRFFFLWKLRYSRVATFFLPTFFLITKMTYSSIEKVELENRIIAYCPNVPIIVLSPSR